MLVGEWVVDYLFPSPIVNLNWGLTSRALQWERVKGSQEFTYQVTLDGAEVFFICCTLVKCAPTSYNVNNYSKLVYAFLKFVMIV